MSINITSSNASTQARDSRGRFTSSEVTNLTPTPKEGNRCQPISMNTIESAAPYIYNFIQDNGVVKALVRDGSVSACVYLCKDTETYYLFITPHNAFGFHLSCGTLCEVLDNDSTIKLSIKHNILYWDTIQRV